MRRSLGGGGGGMGGGNGGGSGMLRTVHRAVRAGVGGAAPEPFSPSSNSTTRKKNTNFNKKKSNPPPNTALTLSSSTGVGCNGSSNSGSSAVSSLINFPVSAASGAAAPPTYSEDLVEWECVDESEDERARGFYEDFVFGAVPSSDEVNHAVYALQQVLGNEVTSPTSVNKSVESEMMDWIEPSLHLCNSDMLQSCGSDRVYDAFHLLQTEPSVQRMVISLSSDKAVWDAVLNNEFVKELRGSIQADEEVGERERSDESNGDSNPIKDMMSWIIVNAREKIMQLIDNITKLVTEAFQTGNEEKRGGKTDLLEEKLKTCLFLSIVVLLIVVVTRAQSA